MLQWLKQQWQSFRLQSVAYEWNRIGREHVAASEFELAVTAFSEALIAKPDLAVSYHNRGMVHFILGNTEASLNDLDRAINLDPNNSGIYAERGLVYHSHGDVKRALADFTAARKHNSASRDLKLLQQTVELIETDTEKPTTDDFAPWNGEIFLTWGIRYHYPDIPVASLKQLNHLVETYPWHALPYGLRAIKLHHEGDFHGATIDYGKAISQKHPDFVILHLLRGTAYLAQDKYTQAIDDFSAAIRFNYTRCAEVHFYRGYARLKNRNPMLAREDFTKVLELDKAIAPAYFLRGIAYRLSDFYDAALEDFEAAISLDSTDPQYFVEQAKVYFKISEPHAALSSISSAENVGLVLSTPERLLRIAIYSQLDNQQMKIHEYTELIREEPNNTKYLAARGWVYLDTGNTDDAMTDFNTVLRFNPLSPSAFYGIGTISYRHENYIEALNSYTTLLHLGLETAALYNNIGACFIRLGEYENALNALQNGIMLDPANNLLNSNLGVTYYLQKDYTQALGFYQKAHELAPDVFDSKAGLAVTHHALGNIDESLKLWRELVEKDERYMDVDWVAEEHDLLPPLVDEARKLIEKLEV